MKWFKHMANAGDDDFIEWLEESYGFEGVGRWWRILEIIAKSMEKNRNDPSAEHTWQKWQTFLRGKRSQLTCYLLAMQLQGKIKLIDTGNVLKITCPNILKMRDEYSRKSGHTPIATPDNVAPYTDTDTEEERKKEKNTKKEKSADDLFSEMETDIVLPDPFEKFWSIFPKARAGNKEKARQSWKKAIDRCHPDHILIGLQAYCQSDQARNYPKGAAAWLNDDRWSWDYSISSQPKQQFTQSPDHRAANPAKNRKVIT